MSFYFRKIPQVIKGLYDQRTWTIVTNDKVIYLTFDDGPHPETTPFLLDTLSKFSAKVTFFQLGSKVLEYHDLHKACIDQGHTIGNHGYAHLDALSVTPSSFISNIAKGAEATHSDLYRPAYGRLPLFRRKTILNNYKVIMWDYMSGDFDSSLSPKRHLEGVLSNLNNGSILVMHENDKAIDKMMKSVPLLLKQYTDQGYTFQSIKPDQL